MNLTAFEYAFLLSTCFVGSIISAITGFAGGMVTLAGVAAVLDTAYIVPIHAAILLSSNVSRVYFYFEYTRWEVVRYFIIGLIPGVIVGLLVFKLLPKDLLKLLMGVFILVSIYWPRKQTTGAMPLVFFIPLAFASGVLSMLFGGTGPFTAPFFFRRKLFKENFIATSGATQTLTHLLKLILFGLIGSNVFIYWRLLLILYLIVILGTWLGKKLLYLISEKVFKVGVYGLLTLLAMNIIIPQLFTIWSLINGSR